MPDDLVTRLRQIADCDARAGEPLGKCMREAAAEITRLKAVIAAAQPLVDRLDHLEDVCRRLDCGVPNQTNVSVRHLRALRAAPSIIKGEEHAT